MITTPPSSTCFGCGPENPHGLQLQFHQAEGGVWADIQLSSRWQSWPGRIHGGVVASVLDEALAWALQVATTRDVVTTTLRVRYVAPLRVDTPYRVHARPAESYLTPNLPAILKAEGEIVTQEGEIVAACDGSFRVISGEEGDGI